MRLSVPGGYSGAYSSAKAPYMQEPANLVTSRAHSAIVFVGSAQSSKTESLILAPLAYNAVVDPMDAIVFCPTNAAARDFAVRRVDRMHRNSPDIGARMSPKSDDDNKRDKKYRDGTILTLSWPSATEFAGRPIPRCFLTDFDRMDEDVDGEGNPFDLAIKRNTTFGSLGITVAESSPSREITDPRWRCTDPHEAPPTTGILSLYNRGDRRLWYWPCPHCNRYFSANFKHLAWDGDGKDIRAAAESAHLVCPHCAGRIEFKDRQEMNEWGLWLRQGEIIDHNGRRAGTPLRSTIASFWLNGTAAGFITWSRLVETYLTALDEFNRTMSVESLKKFYNTDMGEIFVPPSAQVTRTPEDLEGRAVAADPQTVPPDVRFLVACVDVQQNAFVVQVHGIAPGRPYDIHIVDRFTIQKSKRTDADEDILWVKPGTYLEDWDLLVEQVMEKTYPLADDRDRHMRVRMTICDSGGKDRTTANAYQFVRTLKKTNPTLAARFHLLKGEKSPRHPRTQIRFPDSSFKGNIDKAGAAGDVPVLFINTMDIKNEASGRLDATETGAGKLHTPDWLPSWFYEELCSENLVGDKWVIAKGGRQRNEAWDLLCYAIAACASSLLNVEKADWENPIHAWMQPQDRNPLVVQAGTGKTAMDVGRERQYNLADLARNLG